MFLPSHVGLQVRVACSGLDGKACPGRRRNDRPASSWDDDTDRDDTSRNPRYDLVPFGSNPRPASFLRGTPGCWPGWPP